MLRNPFLTENSSRVESSANKSRVTASGFTETDMNYSKSVIEEPEFGYKVPIIKFNGPVPEGFTVGITSWYDADNNQYSKEVLVKSDDNIRPERKTNDNRFSFLPGDDLSKTYVPYLNEKGKNRKERLRSKRRDSIMRDDEESSDEETQVNTVKPTDSVSQVKPLNVQKARFNSQNLMTYPEESNIQRGLNSQFEQSIAISNNGSCFYNDVIGGYGQTADDKIDELDAISKIQKITGLPQIFVNSRLNFLIHLHKPLQEIMSRGSVYPCDDSLWKLSEFMRKYKTSRRDPHKDLLHQVVSTTIKNDRVRSNPFCLPLLEVGMYLNDKLIYISFSQLYQEYQIEWFKSMKDIEPPKFHSAYTSFSSSKHDKVNSRPEERRRKKSGSVISGFGF